MTDSSVNRSSMFKLSLEMT